MTQKLEAQEQTVVKTVSMPQEDWDYLDFLADLWGISRSAANRIIVRRHKQTNIQELDQLPEAA